MPSLWYEDKSGLDMNKKIMLVGIAVLLICVGLSGCNEELSGTIAESIPSVKIYADNISGEWPLLVSFNCDLENFKVEPEYFSWDFGGRNASRLRNASWLFKSPGNYNVSLQVCYVNPWIYT